LVLPARKVGLKEHFTCKAPSAANYKYI